MSYYIVLHDGAKQGPFTLEELQARVYAGDLGPGVLLEDAETGRSIYADQVPNLIWSKAPVEGVIGTEAPEPAGPPPKKKSPVVLWVIVAAVVVCFCGAIPAAILFPVFSQARAVAKLTEAQGELKQISLAVYTYAGENNDLLPPDMSHEGLKASLAGSLPIGTDLILGESYQVEGNPDLAGAKLSTITDPDRTLMIFSSTPWAVGDDEVRFISFSDGSVQRINEIEFQSMVLNGYTRP